jgi:ketosteroid isomerase-like protein
MSDHKRIVERYHAGFRERDHAKVLDLLTDDVAWDLPGFRHLVGKEAFDGEIANPSFEGAPELRIDRLIEEGDSVVAVGEGRATAVGAGDLGFAFAYCDVFTFRGDLIARVESYVVPLTPATSLAAPAGSGS